ncbi:MAG: hypothetical protein K1W00_07815, partial [Lachnospiraceae bacterium]
LEDGGISLIEFLTLFEALKNIYNSLPHPVPDTALRSYTPFILKPRITCKELSFPNIQINIFKASEHGRNSINEIPPSSKLRA